MVKEFPVPPLILLLNSPVGAMSPQVYQVTASSSFLCFFSFSKVNFREWCSSIYANYPSFRNQNSVASLTYV